MRFLLAIPMVLALCLLAFSGDVLGPCGSPQENEPAQPAAATPGVPAPGLAIAPIPLPGQRAVNFELPAVVGSEIKTIKLSDYNGTWRVLCFYPADFTFV